MSSAAACRIDEQNPWPGLSAFDESAEHFFNGRRNETAELRRLVLNASLTVLFGASGLGKTSLIQAGLFPASRKEHFLPVYVRLDVRDRQAPIIQQVSTAFQQQILEHRVDVPAFRKGESLWEYLHRPTLELWSARNQLLIPMFVFDQFEEVFTLGAENTGAIRQLRIDLADLIENRIPDRLSKSYQGNGSSADRLAVDALRYKVILSFREDFLPSLEGWKRDLPSIARNRFRLLPLSERRAFDAIHETAPHLVDKKIAGDIVRFVTAAREGTDGQASADESTESTVEPALLSLVCHGLNEKRKAQNKTRFDEELLKGAKESIIADFYRSGVRDLPGRVRDFIRKELITERGFRKQCDVDDARKLYKVTEKQLRLLVDRRLLRIEPCQGSDRAELTHDLLTRVVREDRDRSRRWRMRQRIMALSIIPAAVFWIALIFVGRAKLAEQKQREMELRRRADLAETQLKTQQLVEEQKLEAQAAQAQVALSSYKEKEAKRDAAEAKRARSEMSVQLLASKAALKGTEGDSSLPLSMLLAAESLRREPLIDNVAILSKGLLLLPKPLGALPNSSKVEALTFSSDGTLVTSEPGFVRIWNPLSRSQVRQFEVPGAASAIGVSHDGKLLAVAYGQDDRGTIRVYNLHSGELEHERNTTGGATYVSVNANGNITALIGNDLFHWKDWADMQGALPANLNVAELLASGGAVAISSDHTLLAAYDPGHSKLSISDFLTGKEKQSWDVGRVLIDDIDFDPSSPKHLVSFDRSGTIRLWSTDTRTAYVNLQTGPIARTFFSPDGRLLGANASDGTIKIWDTRDGKEVATTAPGQEGAKATALDGLHGLVAFTQGRAVQLAEIGAKPLPDLSPVQRVFGIQPELHLAAGACGTLSFCAVRFDNGTHANLTGTTLTLTNVTFSSDGRFVAGNSRRLVLTRSNQPKENLLSVVWDISTGSQIPTQLNPPNRRILGFTPDSNGLIVTTEDDQTAKSSTTQNTEIRDMRQPEHNIPVPQALQTAPASLAFSADGHWLATTNAVSVTTGAPAEREPDVRYVIKLWHWPDGKVPVRTADVGTRVSKMAFSSDHRFLVTSAAEAFLRIWDTNTGKEVGRVGLYRNGVPVAIAFTDADQRVVAYDRYSVTDSFWRPEDLKREVCQRVGRSLTVQEWDQYVPGEKDKYFPTCSDYLRPQ